MEKIKNLKIHRFAFLPAIFLVFVLLFTTHVFAAGASVKTPGEIIDATCSKEDVNCILTTSIKIKITRIGESLSITSDNLASGWNIFTNILIDNSIDSLNNNKNLVIALGQASQSTSSALADGWSIFTNQLIDNSINTLTAHKQFADNLSNNLTQGTLAYTNTVLNIPDQVGRVFSSTKDLGLATTAHSLTNSVPSVSQLTASVGDSLLGVSNGISDGWVSFTNTILNNTKQSLTNTKDLAISIWNNITSIPETLKNGAETFIATLKGPEPTTPQVTIPKSLVTTSVVPKTAEEQPTLPTPTPTKVVTTPTRSITQNITQQQRDIIINQYDSSILPRIEGIELALANSISHNTNQTDSTYNSVISSINSASNNITEEGVLNNPTINTGKLYDPLINNATITNSTFSGTTVTAAEFIGHLTGNITGDTTGNVIGNVTGNVAGNLTGNADTATTLKNPRTIANVSFDGSTDISIASTNLSDTTNIARLDAANTFTNTGNTSFAGNVGIGNTNPLNLLTLANNQSLAWKNSTNTGETTFIRSTTADDLQFSTNGVSMTILSGGNTGIGTTNPRVKLELGGDGSFLATGSYGSGWTEPNLGSGTRMFWYPSKASFRAGYVDGTQWNDSNIGSYSSATNKNTTASGTNSNATNDNTTASSYDSTAIGRYNVGGGTATSWVSTDPLFEVGIGTDSSHKANALTVYKNGNVQVAGSITGNLIGDVTGNLTGNADTATTLQFARNIAGVSFDGSSDIAIASTDLSDTTNIARLDATNTFTNTGNTSFAGNVGIGTSSPMAMLDIKVGASGSVFNTTFLGTGLDDAVVSGTYTGTNAPGENTYYFGMGSNGPVDTFGYSDALHECSDQNYVPITGGPQLLCNGIYVTFGHVTGHDPFNGPWVTKVLSIGNSNVVPAFSINDGVNKYFTVNAGVANSNFIGDGAGDSAMNAIHSNFLGYNSGNGAVSASYSNLFGYQAGKSFTANSIGSNNIIIGTNISLPDATANTMNLGGVLFATGLNSDTSGDPLTTPVNGGMVGIGTNNPSQLLSVGSSNQFTVTSSGAVTSVGINSGSGLIEGTGGLTITGAISLPNSSITNANLANSTISGISLGSNLATLTFGTHLTGTSYNGSTITTIGTDATDANTVSTIVSRDTSGNFSAGTITASLTGHSSLDLPLTGGTMTGGITNSTVANPLTTLAESWIGPSSTAGIYFKGGNVGIGTTSPTYKLEVSGQTNLLDTTNWNSGSGVITWGTFSGVPAFSIRGGSGNGLNFGTNNSFGQMVIDTSGNVGIGTTGPIKKLQVNGDLLINGGYSLFFGQALYPDSLAGISDIYTAADDHGLAFYTAYGAASEKMRITSAGNVGIGTTGPGAKLTVAGPNDLIGNALIFNVPESHQGGQDILRIYNSYQAPNYLATDDGSILSIGTRGGSPKFLSMVAHGSVYMATEAGNVGIGTTGPIVKLNVHGGTGDTGATDPQFALSRLTSVGNNEVVKLRLLEQDVNFGTFVIQTKSTASSAENDAYYTNALAIQSNGNVGIGTTNPLTKLNVKQGASDTTGIRISRAQADGNPMLQFSDDVTYSNQIMLIAGTSNLSIAPYGGNVGIGTTAPGLKTEIAGTTGFPATSGTTQTGTLRLGYDDGSWIMDMGVMSGTGGWIQSTNKANLANANALMLNPNGGNVGIGTTSPSKNLSVFSSSSNNTAQQVIWDAGSTSKLYLGTFSNNAYLSLGGTYSSGWSADGTNSIAVINMSATNGASTVSFATSQTNGASPTERMRIDSNGNVGIGTTAPASKLEIMSAATAGVIEGLRLTNPQNAATIGDGVFIRFQNTSDSNVNRWASIGSISGDYYGQNVGLNFSTNTGSSAPTEKMRILGNGNVGIGTTAPGRKLEIKTGDISNNSDGLIFHGDGSSIKFANAADTAQRMVIGYNSSDSSGYDGAIGSSYILASTTDLYLNAASGYRNIILQTAPYAGNVGIGTTNPQQKLDVNGSINANGNVIFNGMLQSVDNGVQGGQTGFQINGWADTHYGGYASGISFKARNWNGTSYDWREAFHTSSTYDMTINSLGTGPLYSNSGTLTNTNPSDIRLKNTINPLNYGLAEIMQLQPKSFYYNDDVNHQRLQYGFIAQEVQQIMPGVVRPIGNGSDMLGLETNGIYVAGIKAIQEMNIKLDDASSLDTTKTTSLGSLITKFLADATNGIGDFYANRVRTKQICVAKADGTEFCADGDKLEAMAKNSTGSSGGNSGGSTGGTTCVAPSTMVNGVCTAPSSDTTCVSPNTMVDGVCKAPEGSGTTTSDISALTTAKTTAQGLITANAAESTTPGDHVVGSLATLTAANAAATGATTDTQAVIDAQVSTLNDAIGVYNAAIVPTP